MITLAAAIPPLRADLQGFTGYRSARSDAVDGAIWLNANEAAWPNAADATGDLRRYPDPQPAALVAALATMLGCDGTQLLVGRGSDELIDLLVRAWCAAGQDAVLATPPVFGMYAVCARLQGAPLLAVPLVDVDGDFRVDLAAVAEAALATSVKLVFLCSPGNPAGGTLPAADVLALARGLAGRALVVVDEAYVDYADSDSLVPLVARQPNLAVLRTLSKAHALAAARVGCLVADPGVIAALRACQAPYPLPAPSLACALQALAAPSRAETAARVRETVAERGRLAHGLHGVEGVRRVHPSQANFLLVRFDDSAAALERLLRAGIVVRDMSAMPQLRDALRISIGTPEQNDRVVAALQDLRA